MSLKFSSEIDLSIRVPEFFVVVNLFFFIVRDVIILICLMSSYGKDNVTNIVVFHVRQFFSEADDNFISSAAVLIFIMAVKFVVTHHPDAYFAAVAIARYQHL